MSEETSTFNKNSADSSVWGVSIRAWIALTLVATVCSNHLIITMCIMIDAIVRKDFSRIGTFTTVSEPLYSMAIGALGYYFGQKQTGKQP